MTLLFIREFKCTREVIGETEITQVILCNGIGSSNLNLAPDVPRNIENFYYIYLEVLKLY